MLLLTRSTNKATANNINIVDFGSGISVVVKPAGSRAQTEICEIPLGIPWEFSKTSLTSKVPPKL